LLAQGIGDVLNKVKPLRKCYIVIAKPNVSVNTAYAYKQFDECGKTHTPDKMGMLYAMQSRDLKEICCKMENVFEQFIAVDNKVEIKEVMRNNGALGVCMSGSGPTVFGIFEDKTLAQKTADELKKFAKDIAVTTPVSKGCKIVSD
jgi:4-diphosphocytidyl-2-C-methyl-D-erythritol kinase